MNHIDSAIKHVFLTGCAPFLYYKTNGEFLNSYHFVLSIFGSKMTKSHFIRKSVIDLLNIKLDDVEGYLDAPTSENITWSKAVAAKVIDLLERLQLKEV